MDEAQPNDAVIGGPPEASLSLLDFNAWIAYQLDSWTAWTEPNGEDWLTWPTMNERFPTIGQLFVHGFSPLHRYADQVAGDEPADDSHLHADSWVAVRTWAELCLERHRTVCAALRAGDAARMVRFQTRSAGELHVTIAECLTHACTHCFWHLGGIAQMLRLGGTAPPQHSDLIFWAAERHALLARDLLAEHE
jgi:uncharacterized damage-inducible protein DinB